MGDYKRAQNYAIHLSLSMDATMDTPPVDEPSVDMFGLVVPPMDTFGAVDHEVLMHYMDEEERGPRVEKLDGTVLTYFMF